MPDNMATTAQTAPVLEISAPDYMDIQSDVSLGFSKDDIELDLGLSDVEHHHNEDIVLDDIGHAAEASMQTVINDYDDFMLDHDITADEKVEVHVADVVSVQEAHSPSVAVPLGDDDLIDYSDDDDDPRNSAALPSPKQSVYNAKTAPVATATALPPSPSPANSSNEHDETHIEEDVRFNISEANEEGTDQQEADVAGTYETPDHKEVAQPVEGEDSSYGQDEEYTGEEQEAPPAASFSEPDDYVDEHFTVSSLLSRPVEAYYEGDAYWLFKDHDTEGDGYWLIDDITVGSSSLADLFQSCRMALGDRIAHENELGLRFKHLHGLELFEDNTACVAVSLERLVDLYFTLNAQDGVSEPDPFCMLIMSRPRFATLLTDIVKVSEQGGGYKGLAAAVEAGETYFEADPKLPIADEMSSEEENGKDPEEHGNGNYDFGVELPHTDGQSSQGENGTEHEEHVAVEHEGVAETEPSAYEQNSTHHTPVERAASSYTPKAAVTDLPAINTNELEHRSGSEVYEDDLIDYSDDDEDDHGKSHSIPDSSPSTATVQGARSLSHRGSGEDPKVSPQTQNDESQQVVLGDDTPLGHQRNSDSDNEGSYQDYSTHEGQDFEEFHVDGTVDTAQPYVDPDFAGLEYQALDDQLSLDFVDGNAYDATGVNSFTGATDLASTDDYLDLGVTDDWATHHDAMLEQPEDVSTLQHDSAARAEEEDAVAQPSAVVVSTTVDADAGSSVNFSDSSPQGHKRSIDDVGDIYAEASDVLDTKRPRV